MVNDHIKKNKIIRYNKFEKLRSKLINNFIIKSENK